MSIADRLSNSDLEEYFTDCLKYSLFSELSSSQNFTVKFKDNFWLFIPREPTQFEVNAKLYDQIYSTISVVAYPILTMIKTPMQLIKVNDDDIFTMRAFKFPFYLGTVQRLETDFDSLLKMQFDSKIPIMKNLYWDFMEHPHAIICGMSGSGKSYYLKTLLYQLSNVSNSDIILIDPKLSDGARFARNNKNIQTVLPNFKDNHGIGNSFLESINKKLIEVEKVMYSRQYYLYKNSTEISTSYKNNPIFIFIDELASLSSKDVTKMLVQEFWSHLSRLALLGRESNIHLIVSLQKPLNTYIDTALREQFSLKMTLGPTTLSSLKLLFDNLDSMPFIPDTNSKGIGICSLGGEYIQPVETPTIIGG